MVMFSTQNQLMFLWLMNSLHQSCIELKYKQVVILLLFNLAILANVAVAVKGETDPERKETKQKVEDDRKHEYPFSTE